MAIGRVIGECMDRHRHDEYLRFLGTIDRTVPAGLDVHVIADNYATHTHLCLDCIHLRIQSKHIIPIYSDGCRTNIQLFDFYLMQRENFDI